MLDVHLRFLHIYYIVELFEGLYSRKQLHFTQKSSSLKKIQPHSSQDLLIEKSICSPAAQQTSAPRSSSREVRIRVPTFSVVYFTSRGTLPTKKETGEKGHLAGEPTSAPETAILLVSLEPLSHLEQDLPRRLLSHPPSWAHRHPDLQAVTSERAARAPEKAPRPEARETERRSVFSVRAGNKCKTDLRMRIHWESAVKSIRELKYLKTTQSSRDLQVAELSN